MMKLLQWVARVRQSVCVPRAGLSDLDLYQGLAVAPGHPVLRSVVEILDRLEESQVEEFGRPNVPREVKADAMAAIGVLREVRMQLEAHRSDAERWLEQMRAKQQG